MRAAVIEQIGEAPRLAEVPEPDGDVLVEVECAPLNPIDVAIGSGRHYGGSPETPFVPGAEAVGRRRDTGERVWVHGRRTGGMAELVAAPEDAMLAVPEGADPVAAGACGIAGMAGWLPVVWRAPVREGDRVLVLGATGTAGQFALQGARLRGAARVVAAGRDPEGLQRALRLGADEAVRLDEVERLRELAPTYVYDPLWGEPLAAAVEAAARGARIVHVGQSAGAEATLTSAAVRGKGLELYGYSNFLVPPEVTAREYAALVGHVTRGEVTIDVERVPFDEVADAWNRQAAGRAKRKLVLVL
ncbi:MAG: zinc-binding alcohol dehydrogenase family protein [Gaiellaceae bacterium]